MSFLRPEAVALVTRWAETAFSGAVLAVMLWTGGSMLYQGLIMGVAILAVAAGAGWWFLAALARARMGRAAPGPGVVEVNERRITYFGPIGGAIVALDSLAEVDVLAGGASADGGDSAWILRAGDGATVTIPAGAEGADQLLETFSALPGFSYDRVLAAMKAGPDVVTAVWRRDAGRRPSALASRAASD